MPDGGGSVTALEIRPLTPADRAAALAVINEAARWYRDFLPAEEVHDPEMTPEQWDGETRRMTWYGAFLRGRLVGVMGLEYAGLKVLVRGDFLTNSARRKSLERNGGQGGN